MLTQQIHKKDIESLLHEYSDIIDAEDFMYRLYVFRKIQEGEQDIRKGRIYSHAQALERLTKRWQTSSGPNVRS
ncbi:MAG: hypothetical protein GY862_37990 [Gammaproteobacteria bacterium]|nr:hypothetical protein [Gammaproteobacteria bacterium]